MELLQWKGGEYCICVEKIGMQLCFYSVALCFLFTRWVDYLAFHAWIYVKDLQIVYRKQPSVE